MATLDTTNNFIETLISNGADAQSSLFEAAFIGGYLTDVSDNLRVRLASFELPETEQDSYTVKFMNASIPRPRAQVKVTKSLDLTFRVDANFIVYKALLNQMNYTFNPTKNYASTDTYALSDTGVGGNNLFEVDLYTVNESVTSTAVGTSLFAKFRNCWIDSIEPLNFKTGTSDPLTVKVHIKFFEMNELQTGFIE